MAEERAQDPIIMKLQKALEQADRILSSLQAESQAEEVKACREKKVPGLDQQRAPAMD